MIKKLVSFILKFHYKTACYLKAIPFFGLLNKSFKKPHILIFLQQLIHFSISQKNSILKIKNKFSN
ncbi:hypothetical protein B7758_06975 [Enterococcus durans]|nr:hypothetical protein B7758_06975 [Enterococcus durans]